MLPSPIRPSTLPRTSTPVNLERVHSPRLTEASAWGMLRAKANRSPIVCSAAAMMLPRGALTPRMPLAVAAGTSMLSTPTPARPTTLRLRPASSTRAVTLVSLRTTSASKPGTSATSWSSVCLVWTSTSPRSRRRATPSSARGSATNIRCPRGTAGSVGCRILGNGSLGRNGRRGLVERGHRRAHPRTLVGADVELFQRLLHGPEDLDHIALGHVAEVADPDHAAVHLALAARDHDPELLSQELAVSLDVKLGPGQRGGHRRRAVALRRQQVEAHALEAGGHRVGAAPVARVCVVEALLEQHPDALPDAEQDGDGGRPGRRPLGRELAVLSPVEIEPGRLAVRLPLPGGLTDRRERDSGRRHPALLAAADDHVGADPVDLDRHRADAG